MKIVLATLLTLFSILCLPGHSFAEKGKKEDIRKIHVKVEYVNSRVGHIEARYVVQAPVETSWKVFNDFDAMSDYIPRLMYAKVLGSKQSLEIIKTQPKSFKDVLRMIDKYSDKPGEKYFINDQGQRSFYMIERFDFPWPLSNRWALYECLQAPEPSQRSFSQNHHLVAGTLKEEKGTWRFRASPSHSQWTEVDYSIISDPGVWMPVFIARAAAKSTVNQMMGAIRKKVESFARREEGTF